MANDAYRGLKIYRVECSVPSTALVVARSEDEAMWLARRNIDVDTDQAVECSLADLDKGERDEVPLAWPSDIGEALGDDGFQSTSKWLRKIRNGGA